MHIEISAGGLSGGIAVASFQNGMKKYISGTDGMISSFKAVKTKTYNLNGGGPGQHLSGAMEDISQRIRTEENRKCGAETVQAKSNSFLDLAIRVDKSVANIVKQDRKELYGQYPGLKPSPGQWVKDRLSDAWNWLCKAGKDIANAAEKTWNAIKDTAQKAWNSIVTFYQEHKQVIDTILIIIGVIAAIAVIIGTGGIAAAGIGAAGATGLGAGLIAILHVPAAIASKIVIGAIATTLIAGAMNLWSTWELPGSDSRAFQIAQTGLNGVVAIITSFALIGGTIGLGMTTLIRDGITKIFGSKLSLGVIEKLAIKGSHFVAKGAFWSTVGTEVMNFVDSLSNTDNEVFNRIQSVLSKTAVVLTTLYGIGLFWDSMKKSLSKNKDLSKEDRVKKNKTDGTVREYHFEEELKLKYPEQKGYSVVKEAYLRDQNGNIVKDPVTGKGRRVDMMVVKDEKVVSSFEVTSKTANKTAQIDKELRIREAGGNFIRDKNGKLIEIPKDVFTEVVRRD